MDILITAIVSIEIFFFLISLNIRKQFQWFITKNRDLDLKFKKDLVYKFKKNSYDTSLGWVPKSNSSKVEFIKSAGEIKKKFKIVKYNFSEYGQRKNTYKPKKKYISTFGDSFVFCKHVNDKDTWQNFLSKKTKSNVINFGVNNYGIDQSLLRYSLIKKNLNTKIVIIGFVPETITRIKSKWKQFYEYGNILGFKPSYRINKNNKLIWEKNPLKNTNILLDNIKLKNLISKLKKQDYWYKSKFSKDLIRFPYSYSFFKNLNRNLKKLINYIFFWLTDNNVYQENAWNVVLEENQKVIKNCYNNKTDTNLLKKIIQKFIKDIEKEKSIPIIVIFPYKIDVLEHKKYKKNYYTDFFKEFEKKVNCIDLTEIISSLRTKELNKFYHSNFFGSHFTPNGNRFCANYIYKYLKRSKVQ